MGRRKVPKIHPWIYRIEASEKFLMLTPDLFEDDGFRELTHAGRLFYILICVHKETDQQRNCLLKALRDYNEIENLGWTEKDILDQAMPNKRSRFTDGYFVIPLKHLEQYGYSAQYASKLKKELIDKGFIKVVFSAKGKFNAWNLNCTIYQFSNTWKYKTKFTRVNSTVNHSLQ